jgi:polyisoprenoid-binding protein YceI
LEQEYFGLMKSPFSGKTCIGFTVTGKINCEDCGKTWNEPMEGSGMGIGKDV